jgi:hypothetical protein
MAFADKKTRKRHLIAADTLKINNLSTEERASSLQAIQTKPTPKPQPTDYCFKILLSPEEYERECTNNE